MFNVRVRSQLHTTLLYTLCILVATVAISCGCANETTSQPPTRSNTHPPARRRNPPPPPPPSPIQVALTRLREAAQKPGVDPKLQAIEQLITSLPAINQEENSQELLDQILRHKSQDAAAPDAVDWLIEQGLLDPNEADEQGKTPLARSIAAWIATPNPQPTQYQVIAQHLYNQGARISPGLANELLRQARSKQDAALNKLLAGLGANLVQEAIQELQEKAQKPGADPKLQAIYQLISSLPPHRFSANEDGTISRINMEKNGQELLDKIIKETIHNEAAPDAVAWLIDQGLVKVNEPDEQGKLPLERLVEPWIEYGYDLDNSYQAIAHVLTDRGAILTPEKASSLLERFIEGQLSKRKHYEHHTIITQLLQDQGATLPSAKATALLQQAGAAQKKALYKTLLDLGADPNIEVVDRFRGKLPLLLSVGKFASHDDPLLKALIENPRTNINVTDKEGYTLAMRVAYEELDTNTVKTLLQREDLDINVQRATGGTHPGFTLLDLVVGNCTNRLAGHLQQRKERLEKNKEWLPLLKALTQHTNFRVTPDNIAKAEKRVESLQKLSVKDAMDQEAEQCAEEALKVLQGK